MANSDDPFRPDPTTMRPRPGGGRRTYVGGARQGASSPPNAMAPDAEPLPAAASGLLAHGLNPLVQAASPLLLLAAQVRDSVAHVDVTALRRHTLDEIRRFEEHARANGVGQETVLAARYTLCTGIDEAVFSTPWGHQSEWAQHPLLVALHREAWGGEKFFDMLERMSKDPARYIDLLELQYLLLAFGFEGKYGKDTVRGRGQEHLRDVQTDLYKLIRQQRGSTAQRALSLRWRGVQDRRNPLVRYVPWWVIALAALPILLLTFTAYYKALAERANPIKQALSMVSLDRPVPVAGPVAGPTLKQLLASDERRGLLTIKENGGVSTITLNRADLFASGSTAINTDYVPLFHRMTDALNKVPGSVRVYGHTDDQPVHTVRFTDNWQLSTARADSVVDLLANGIDNRARLSAVGMGSSKPLASGSDPESRALNRRVEIEHIRGS